MFFNIKENGAIGDGVFNNTKIIQRGIDEVSASGGGTVYIENGIYLTGSLRMKDNVTLQIAPSATLLGSSKSADYPEWENLEHVNSEMLPRYRNACLILAHECKNIAVTGGGTVDCNGKSFVKKKSENPDAWTGWEYIRIDEPTPPRGIFAVGCKDVRIEGISFLDAPAGWAFWIHDCDYVTFDKCKILSDVHSPNSDGIHINSCRNVVISNCMIRSGDDAIVVRANNASLSENKVCESISVTNCTLTSYASGIRIGYVNDGTIRNCVFSNIVMTDSDVGICIELPKVRDRFDKKQVGAADQGTEATLIENISFQNIVMDRNYAFAVKLFIDDSELTRCESIRNIYFNAVRARGLELLYLKGRENCKLENIRFSDCSFEKVSDSVLPDYVHHGAAAWDRKPGMPLLQNVKDVAFVNTSFSC